MEGKRQAIQSLDDLPEELLDQVASILDQSPPSLVSNLSEPSLDALFSAHCPLKALSLTSRKWRNKAAPLIFQYLRIPFETLHDCLKCDWDYRVDIDDKSARAGEPKLLQNRRWQNSPFESGLDARLIGYRSSFSVTLAKDNGDIVELAWSDISEQDREYAELVAEHITPDLYTVHPSGDNFAFNRLPELAKRYNLLQKPLSLVVYTSLGRGEAFHDRSLCEGGRLLSTMWTKALNFLDPYRIVLIAPPSTIAPLTSCWSDTSDEWAFSIPYQRVELCTHVRDNPHANRQKSKGNQSNSTLQYLPTNLRPLDPWRQMEYDLSSKHSSGILHASHWSSMEYDEGSSLNAYGTYHYFEKRPPCILNGTCFQLHQMGLWLRSFTYRAIFPHYAHFNVVLDTLVRLYTLRQLRLQLAPDPTSSRLLDDQEFVGKGNLSLRDCWNEVEKCYEALVQEVLMPSSRGGPDSQSFVGGVYHGEGPYPVDPPPLFLLLDFTSDDYRIPAMREVLNRIFDRHAENRWVKSGPSSWAPTYLK